MDTNIVLAQVMNINSPQGKASVLYISVHTLQVVLKFACIVLMSAHI